MGEPMGIQQDVLPLEMPSGGMRALRGLGFEAIRAFFVVPSSG